MSFAQPCIPDLDGRATECFFSVEIESLGSTKADPQVLKPYSPKLCVGLGMVKPGEPVVGIFCFQSVGVGVPVVPLGVNWAPPRQASEILGPTRMWVTSPVGPSTSS